MRYISREKFIYEFTQNQATNDEIHENILEGMNVHGANFIILMCAIIIASVGLNMNASAVIIGAMLISPLMGSIIGIGYGVGTYNIKLLKQAFKILLLAIIISISTSTFYFSLTPITIAGSEILSRISPTIWDVIIAFVGGIAGMIGLTRNKSSNVIPGVAIATALMPPLCTAGYGLAMKDLKFFLGAGYLFFLNSFFIIIATFIMTKFLNLPKRTELEEEKQKSVKRFITVLSILVMIPSMISAFSMISETIDEGNLSQFISNELTNEYVISKEINYDKNTITLVVIGDKISDKKIQSLESKLSYYGFNDKELIIKQDNNNILEIEKYINDIRKNGDVSVGHNTKSNIQEQDIDIKSISNEIKVLYPKVSDVFAGYIKNESNIDKYIPILILYSIDSNLNDEILKLENWYKIRTNSDEVRVYIEEDKLQ